MYIILEKDEDGNATLAGYALYSDFDEAKNAAREIVAYELDPKDKTTVFIHKIKDDPLSAFYWRIQEDQL